METFRQLEKRFKTKADGGPWWLQGCRCCLPPGMRGKKGRSELKRRYHRDYRNNLKRETRSIVTAETKELE